jgi:hypothetical protein
LSGRLYAYVTGGSCDAEIGTMIRTSDKRKLELGRKLRHEARQNFLGSLRWRLCLQLRPQKKDGEHCQDEGKNTLREHDES